MDMDLRYNPLMTIELNSKYSTPGFHRNRRSVTTVRWRINCQNETIIYFHPRCIPLALIGCSDALPRRRARPSKISMRWDSTQISIDNTYPTSDIYPIVSVSLSHLMNTRSWSLVLPSNPIRFFLIGSLPRLSLVPLPRHTLLQPPPAHLSRIPATLPLARLGIH